MDAYIFFAFILISILAERLSGSTCDDGPDDEGPGLTWSRLPFRLGSDHHGLPRRSRPRFGRGDVDGLMDRPPTRRTTSPAAAAAPTVREPVLVLRPPGCTRAARLRIVFEILPVSRRKRSGGYGSRCRHAAVTFLSFHGLAAPLFVSGINATCAPSTCSRRVISIPTGFIFLNAMGRSALSDPLHGADALRLVFLQFPDRRPSGFSSPTCRATSHARQLLRDGHFHYTIMGGSSSPSSRRRTTGCRKRRASRSPTARKIHFLADVVLFNLTSPALAAGFLDCRAGSHYAHASQALNAFVRSAFVLVLDADSSWHLVCRWCSFGCRPRRTPGSPLAQWQIASPPPFTTSSGIPVIAPDLRVRRPERASVADFGREPSRGGKRR